MDDLVSQEGPDLAAAAAGDPEAFTRIYDRHGAVVLSLCRRHLSGHGDLLAEAEDAAQETFIRAFRKLAELDHPDRLRPWLYAIARRVCWEHRRARRGRRARENGAAERSRRRPIGPDIAGEVEHDDDLRRLGAALDRLAPRERLALHLHCLDPNPAQAAAGALGLSRSAYYKLVARARERLAAELGVMRSP